MIRKVKVEEEEDREAHEEAEWPQHLALRPSPFPPPDLGSLAAAYKLEPGAPGTLGGLALAGWVPTASEKPYGCGECERRFRALLQGIFPTQGLNLGLPHCRWILYHLSH